MHHAARVAVFDVLTRTKTRAVLDACWQWRGRPGPSPDTLRSELGSGTVDAIRRLVDLQLLDCDTGCEVRSMYLWNIVSATWRLPAGDQFFDLARNPARCALLEELAAGPVVRERLNELGRSPGWASQTLKMLRLLRMLDSECGEQTVRLVDREQVLWIFLLTDQLLMDVHATTSQRYRRERARHHALAGWEPEDDEPLSRRHVSTRAWHPAVDVADAERVDHPVGTYEALVDDRLQELVKDRLVRSASLAGAYPATKVRVGLYDAETSQPLTLTADLWSRRFGLATEDLRAPPPHLPAPRQVAERVRDWVLDAAASA